MDAGIRRRIFLAPSMFGFVTKFMEFVRTFQGSSDGVFAITPMVNYLLASLGFFCLLVWAACNGMFEDIEQPKVTMLENEQAFDRQRGIISWSLASSTFPRAISTLILVRSRMSTRKKARMFDHFLRNETFRTGSLLPGSEP